MVNNNNISIFQNEDGAISVNVLIRENTMWLSLNQISELFGRDKSVISRHLKNIFKEEELEQDSTVAFFATVQKEGEKEVTRNIEYFNLDAIISVGYRVNSKQGTKFRKWATNTLNQYMMKGYTINENISKEKIKEIKEVISMMSSALARHDAIDDQSLNILRIISLYADTWSCLLKYDDDNFDKEITLKQEEFLTILGYDEVTLAINTLKSDLVRKNEASNLFGKIKDNEQIKGIIEGLDQGFGGEYLYKTNASRAAHLLYFIIKDHPFIDGNKRIGSLLFMIFLEKSQVDLGVINTNSLTLLALLVAESDPKQKDIMIKLIQYIICS